MRATGCERNDGHAVDDGTSRFGRSGTGVLMVVARDRTERPCILGIIARGVAVALSGQTRSGCLALLVAGEAAIRSTVVVPQAIVAARNDGAGLGRRAD